MKAERSKVDQELRKLGFGGLDDPNIVSQIAFCIRDHNQFRSQLFSVDPDKRRLAYEQLRPHLRFAAKPLDVYEAEMKLMAEQHQLPTWDASAYPKPFKVPEIGLDELAQEAIRQNAHERDGGLIVTCAKCTRQDTFRGKLRKEAEKSAHTAGWRSDGQKSWCPRHAPSRCTMTLECASCTRKAEIRCWDPQDGYSTARTAGWVITAEDANCPRCSVPKILLQ